MQLAIDSRVFVFHDDNERKTRWWNARFPPQVIAQISPRILTRRGDFLSRRIEIHRRATHSGERKLATDTSHGQKQHLKQRNSSLWIQAERNKKLTLTILHAIWRLRISFPSRRRELLSLGSGDVLFKIFINICKLSLLIIVFIWFSFLRWLYYVHIRIRYFLLCQTSHATHGSKESRCEMHGTKTWSCSVSQSGTMDSIKDLNL